MRSSDLHWFPFLETNAIYCVADPGEAGRIKIRDACWMGMSVVDVPKYEF
jgi:hypothetical protein